MDNIKITLHWRITITAILITIISSLAIVLAINIDISRRIPIFAQEIMQSEVKSNEAVGSTGIVAFEEGRALGELEGYSQIQVKMDDEVSRIYTTSIIVFITIIVISGVSTYFIAGKALKPVKDLKESIKRVNENNLLVNLDVKGPQDEIKELTISFNQMLAKIDNAFTSQKRFNSSVAHELKTPLAVMKTNIDVLNDGEVKNVDEYKRVLEIVENTVVNMNSIIEALLDMVRQENAPLDDEVDIKGIIEEVIEDLEIIAKGNNVALQSELNRLPVIKGNEVLIYRAIYNIVENAIKYNKQGGTVVLTCNVNKDKIEIKVKDTGVGITKEEMKNIFEPFYRCNKENEVNGLGLGLSLVKSVINLHSGEIKVESDVEQGSIFIINLPVL